MSKIDAAPDSGTLGTGLQGAVHAIPEAKRYVIALSGGLDSTCLLHFCVAMLWSRQAQIDVIHVNHGLSPESDRWARHCVQMCKKLGLICQVEKVKVASRGEGLEAAAREARYAVFRDCLKDGGILLQGHHLNDQAETVLMRLVRGSGPEGLAGIPRQRALGNGEIYRPWLDISRSELADRADEFGLEWVEDESNQDTSFDRNYVRHNILPALEARWSTVLQSLSQVAERCAESQSLIERWASEALHDALSQRYASEGALDAEILQSHDLLQQQALVSHWLHLQHAPHPPAAIYERIWGEMLTAERDAQPLVQWGAFQIRRHDNCLFLLRSDQLHDADYSHTLEFSHKCLPVEFDCAGIECRLFLLPSGQPIPENVAVLRLPEPETLISIRNRKGGEKIRLHAQGHRQSLKKILQQEHVPPWQREVLPLVFYDDTLVMVGRNMIADGYRPEFGQDALAVQFLR